jgi:alpha-tubulin suppressor-like RCC1 family protein
MSRKRKTAILFGLCAALAACDDTSTRDVTGPMMEPTDPGVPRAEATLASAPLAFRQVSAGLWHTCGVTEDNRAYCWGLGGLGDGTTMQRLVPTLVRGGLHFRQISAGEAHTCGVTAENRAYCWGSNFFGQLGNGSQSFDPSLRPVAVAGGHLFRQVSAGSEHTCAVTTDDRVFCWGSNTAGQLGKGTVEPTNSPTLTPVAIAGTLRFRGVSVAVYHTCGVTIDNRAYCWGGDQWGQIGDGSGSGSCGVPDGPQVCRAKPTLVAGGYRFRQVDAGGGHGPGEDTPGTDGGRTCGVTTDDRAFCWGDGSHGQNGDGTQQMRSSPRLVAGGLHFRSVSAGLWHTCGVSTDGRAYCWGWNTGGQIGDGTLETLRLRPRAVLGGHLFAQVSAGGDHTCGTTPANVAYCWGANGNGALGDGTATGYRLKPRAVVGPL